MPALYTVSRFQWVRPVAHPEAKPVFFDHIDGAYSYCLTDEGRVVHLAAWTDVEVIPRSLP